MFSKNKILESLLKKTNKKIKQETNLGSRKPIKKAPEPLWDRDPPL